MPRHKKPFINKKKSVTFQLVHRSQKDPLAADEDAPQRVLIPCQEKVNISDSVSECNYEHEVRLTEMKSFGIGFEDDYDYMQHLKEPTEQTIATLVPKDNEGCIEMVDDDEDGMTEVSMNEVVFKLPSIVFGSKTEEPIGMLHRAVVPTGPQPSWDPDIVAGLDEDFKFDDPENILDDDFIQMATKSEEEDKMEDEEFESESEKDFASDKSYSEYSFDDDQQEETKSRFTNYSMTSSVIRRNDQLTLLDDKFERFFQTYDDSNIGDLNHVEINGGIPVDDIDKVKGLKMLLGIKEEREEGQYEPLSPQQKKETCERVMHSEEREEEMVTIVREEWSNQWDCQSILSTYSNKYNHPKLIKEPVMRKVKVSDSTGVPLNNAPRLTKKELRLHNEAMEETEPAPVVPARRKGETKEEKQERKQAVKEGQRERRKEKKATKIAFQQERTRQSKQLHNIKENLSGIRIS